MNTAEAIKIFARKWNGNKMVRKEKETTRKRHLQQVQQGKGEVELLQELNRYIQAAAVLTQEELSRRVSELIHQAVKTVFGDDYDFKLMFETAYGRSECHLVLLKDGQVIFPMEGSGGGVIDIIAFAARFSAWRLSGGQVDGFFIFDEPVKNLSKNHYDFMRVFIEELVNELGLRFLIITHEPELLEGGGTRVHVENGKVVQ